MEVVLGVFKWAAVVFAAGIVAAEGGRTQGGMT